MKSFPMSKYLNLTDLYKDKAKHYEGLLKFLCECEDTRTALSNTLPVSYTKNPEVFFEELVDVLEESMMYREAQKETLV